MRVALFYFFYLAITGVSLPYLPKYLNSLGYSGQDISAISTLSPLQSMFVPLMWGFVADRTGKPARLVKIAVTGVACSVLPLTFMRSYSGIFTACVFYAFFACAIQSLADTVAVAEARRIGTDYGRLRLWGSISFIVTSWGFDQYLAAGGSLGFVPIVMALLAIVAACVVHVLREPWERRQPAGPWVRGLPARDGARNPPTLRDARTLAAEPALLWFFIAGMIHQAGLAPYYVFYAIHIDEHHIGSSVVGWSMAIGVAAEVLMFYAFRNVLKRIPLFPMMAFCFLISALRWFLVARIESAPLMIGLQTLHAFSFAFYYAGSIAHLEQTVAEPLRGTGRALFQAITLGMGMVLGLQLAGRLKDGFGTAAAFNTAAILDLVALAPLLLAAKYSKNAMAERSKPMEEDALEPDA